MEEPNQDGSLPFLDIQVHQVPTTPLSPQSTESPHTNQYLHWDSNHFIKAKHCVYNTLAHRAKVVSSKQPSLHKELDHIIKACQSCHFPTWALNKLHQNFECKHYTNIKPRSMGKQSSNKDNDSGTNSNKKNSKIIVVTYIQGLGEHFKGCATKRNTSTFQRHKHNKNIPHGT